MKKDFLKFKSKLKEKARQLRKNSTLSEILLWQHLKGKQLEGFDFHRQKPIDKYIVDFFCPALMLAIEIDGQSHEEKAEEDDARQKYLEKLGVHFLRFDDKEVKRNIEGILENIRKWVKENDQVNDTPRPNGHPNRDNDTPRPNGHPSREGNL